MLNILPTMSLSEGKPIDALDFVKILDLVSTDDRFQYLAMGTSDAEDENVHKRLAQLKDAEFAKAHTGALRAGKYVMGISEPLVRALVTRGLYIVLEYADGHGYDPQFRIDLYEYARLFEHLFGDVLFVRHALSGTELGPWLDPKDQFELKDASTRVLNRRHEAQRRAELISSYSLAIFSVESVRALLALVGENWAHVTIGDRVHLILYGKRIQQAWAYGFATNAEYREELALDLASAMLCAGVSVWNVEIWNSEPWQIRPVGRAMERDTSVLDFVEGIARDRGEWLGLSRLNKKHD
ncbi:hypothetical protein WMF30_41575 [Sorangium sp. So ce134]